MWRLLCVASIALRSARHHPRADRAATAAAAFDRVHEVSGDGDCLFSAIAAAEALADGSIVPAGSALSDRAAELRSSAMDLLCPTGVPDGALTLGGLPVDLLIELQPGEDGRGYCSRLRRRGEWGSTAEILALSHVLGRPISVHTDFGEQAFGDGEASGALALRFRGNHYDAVRLRGGACEETGAEEAVGRVLDRLHAAAAAADADAYFALFRPEAVFYGTDPGERWPLDEFRAYAGARFAAGDGWEYSVQERHVTVRGDVAWFDEALDGKVLGPTRGTGVLVDDGAAAGGWRLAAYSLGMAVRNEVAGEVARLNKKGRGVASSQGE